MIVHLQSINQKINIMKKGIIFTVLIVLTLGLYAQDKASYLVDLNVGSRLLKMQTSDNSGYECAMADLGGSVGFAYMFANITEEDFLRSIGLKLDFGYYIVTANQVNSDAKTQSNIMRISGQGIIDVDDLFGMNMAPFGLLAHGGLGIGLLDNKDMSSIGPDRMLNFMAGIQPVYWINESMAVTLDFSFVALTKVNNGIEMIKLKENQSNFAYFANASIGFTYGF